MPPRFLQQLNKRCVGIPSSKLERLLTNNRGVVYMAVIVVMLLSCLAYLALGSSSAKVLNWILK